MMQGALRLLLLVATVMVPGCATDGLVATTQLGCLKGLRVALTHVDTHDNYTNLQLLRWVARRSHHRMSRLVARTTGVPTSGSIKAAAPAGAELQVPVHAGNGEFLMDLSVGTPALAYSAIVDPGRDLVWTQCKPCVNCFTQSMPVFDPSSSSTYANLPCSSSLCGDLPTSTCTSASRCGYTYTYDDSSLTQWVLTKLPVWAGLSQGRSDPESWN